MDRNHDVISFFTKTFILRRTGVAIFGNIINITSMFINAILNNSRKVRKIRIYLDGT